MPRDPKKLRKRLALALRRERTRLDLTQEQVAEAAQLNPRHYQKLEEGSVNVTLSTLEQVAAALKREPWELLHPKTVEE